MSEKQSNGSLESLKNSKVDPQRPTFIDLDGSSCNGSANDQQGQMERKHVSSAEEEISSVATEGESPNAEDDSAGPDTKSPDVDEPTRPGSRSHRLAESLKSKIRDLSPSRPHSPGSSPKVKQKSAKKVRKDSVRSTRSPSAWLPASINQMFSNKNKSEEFKRLFKDLPDTEQLIVDYSCALQRDILVHGRLYLSHNWLCFYANIFGWETIVTLRFSEISGITKEKTALVIPNAIQISTQTEKYFFASFISRDTTFTALFKVWQNALLDQPLSAMELIQMIGKYSDSRPDLSSDNDSDDEKDISEGFGNDSDSEYTSNGLDDEVSSSDSDTAQLLSPTMIPDPKKGDNFSYKENEDNITAPEVAVTPPTPTKMPVEDLLKNSVASLDSKVDHRDRNTEHSSRSSSPKPDSLKIKNNKRAAKRSGSPSPQKLKESTDEVEEETASDINVENEGPHRCFCEQHFCQEMLNEEYPVSVDKVFEYLFTEHEFYKKVQRMRKTQDLVFEPWYKTENGERRVIRYTVQLNYSIGPKTSPTTEIQNCLKGSVPGRVYVVEVEVTNEGIPYGDTFKILNKYCITSTTSKSCRLRITSEVQYKKSVWGFVKNMIDKNSAEGLQGYFNMLGSNLRKETEAGTTRRPNRRRRSSPSGRRHKRNRSLKDNIFIKPSVESTAQLMDSQTSMENKSQWLAYLKQRFHFEDIKMEHSFVIVVSFVLFTLLLINLFLVYRLISLEHAYQQTYGLTIDSKNLPADAKEWAKLLQQQSYLHKVERLRFQQILDSSVGLMNQVQTMLTELQTELDHSKHREFPSVADFPQAAEK